MIACLCRPLPPPLDGESKRGRERRAALALLRRLVCDPHADISHRPTGEPYVATMPWLSVSVSHSARRVAVAVATGCRVGIDVEEPSERVGRTVPRIMRPDEAPTAPPAALDCWTAKEAVFKAAGIPGAVLSDITLGPGGEARIGSRRFTVEWTGEGLALAFTPSRD